MRFILETTSYGSNLIEYCEKLKPLGFKFTIDKTNECHPIALIHIDTLQELIEIREIIGKEIILVNMLTLEIYDTYRE